MDIAKEDILFLSPSKPIIKTILEVFARTGQQFLVHEAVMDDAVRLANASIEKNGTKVIVSNGGTASLLKRRVQAHILEIRYTNFDLVHAITTALEYSPSVAIVGFESFIYNAVQVRDFSSRRCSSKPWTALMKSVPGSRGSSKTASGLSSAALPWSTRRGKPEPTVCI